MTYRGKKYRKLKNNERIVDTDKIRPSGFLVLLPVGVSAGKYVYQYPSEISFYRQIKKGVKRK